MINYNSLSRTGIPLLQIYIDRKIKGEREIHKSMAETENLFLTKECQLIKIEGMVTLQSYK